MFGCLQRSVVCLLMVALMSLSSTAADQPTRLRIGWAKVDITPPEPVALVGQHYMRIAKPEDQHDPLLGTVMAVEADNGEQAILISVDLMAGYDLGIRLRPLLAQRVPELDSRRIILFATHSHTAPYLSNKSGLPAGTMNGTEYRAFLLERLADAVVAAWSSRRPGRVGWASGQAAIGFCRVAVYQDGKARMYGDTARPDFAHMEGPHDHSVEMLFAWSAEGELQGVLVNVAAPAQVLEQKTILSADYWHAVRDELVGAPRFGEEVFLLPMCGAAGDQSPRDLQNAALTRKETHGFAGVDAIGQELVKVIAEGLSKAEANSSDTLRFEHLFQAFELPLKEGHGEGSFPMEMHALRLGDIALLDVPMELYTAYGLEIKTRSPAKQTFIAQLASGPAYGMYLPTPVALPGGAYGSRLENGKVGPPGGRILVEKALSMIRELFAEQKKESIDGDIP